MTEENQDREWQEEKNRVHLVVDEIKRKINILRSRVSQLKDNVLDIRREFWDDVTVNIEELDDRIETEASIKQQQEFLSERERSHGKASEQLETLDKLKHSPYFGRIDFQQDGEDTEQQIYIGLASVMDENDEHFLVYDWRAPIASMYYDFPPGPANYDTVQGNISGEINVKRQYLIRDGELKGMFDTGLTIGDHLLQSVLGNQASTKMKSIVATIQREQNRIIRNEKHKVLMVQGVAGSGKTSAALQRVAYLLYRYRETLTSEQMVLFSPNPLFNSYVSTVLPDLGEDNMQQMTFYQFLDSQLSEQFQLETPFEQMEFYLQQNRSEKDSLREQAMHYKASFSFQQMIDQYLDQLAESGISFRGITFRGQMIIPKKAIAQYFYKTERTLSIPDRLEQVSNWILYQLKKLEKVEREKDWVLEETELLDKADYMDVYHTLQEEHDFSEDTFHDYEREEALLRKRVVNWRLRPLRAKVKQLAFVDVLKTYRQLFSQRIHQDLAVEMPDRWQEISQMTDEYLAQKYLTWEDAPAYIYFEKSLLGFDAQRTIQHVFIDEAQDYTPMQFELMKKMYPVSRFTMLGDINQGIYAHSVAEETILSDQLPDEHERIVLTRSYRSTRPIVEFTKSMMPDGDLIQPFEREGNLPIVMEVEQPEMAKEKVIEQINHYQEQGHETIAIIGKTIKECRLIHQYLSDSVNVELMSESAHTFGKGVVVIPVYLAKGIEFDAVILFNASRENYQHELERNLFYTACTRAMHDLALFSIGTPSHFVDDIPNDLYRHYKMHEIPVKSSE
ncbi:ATP-dependent DNA helicase [Gracilibacillus halophilus YIM-C55.5]|uniref:ATP-dependent DNA helicase n=1 Tax=Gracilibacillus halophilus YIM-C55.5 TaxID=1308866 RepID=N4WXD3_9BACI|nr:ATP-dependent DNA helicase [Gracilibacillus halophilus YIM-C55.5]